VEVLMPPAGQKEKHVTDVDASTGMDERMRAVDWANTPLGASAQWPQSLRSALSICLGASFPIAIYWGSDLALLYNEAWSPILGRKHPHALGRAGREVWPEIWDTIGPMFNGVMETGIATRSRDSLLAMRRHGFTEECYFDYTFSPILDEAGKVGGIFNAVIETTFRVVGERRTRTLRELTDALADARSVDDVCARAAATLRTAGFDIPFFLLYTREHEAEARALRLSACAGVDPVGWAPEAIAADGGPLLFCGRSIASTSAAALVSGLAEGPTLELSSPWPEPCDQAYCTPLGSGVAGLLIAGISPRLAFDASYREFIERVATVIAGAIGRAQAMEHERRRVAAMAELDRAKTEFFSNVSHEFRTPVALILGPIEETLENPALAPEVRDALVLARRNALRLSKLVNSLLDFSRIEAGRVQTSYEPTDLAQFTSELAGSFSSAMHSAGLTYELQCDALSQPVFIDRDMWEKIVLNLISNAFKFTFAGKVRVSVQETDGGAVLEVSDTGVGVPAEELPRLFERFHRIANSRSRTHEGSGIGLSLVQELVRLHGGTIEVSSQFGLGTTFRIRVPFGSAHLPPQQVHAARTLGSTAIHSGAYVEEALRWLPQDAAADRPAPTREAEPRVRATAGASILLADDNADMREYVRRLLAPYYEVTTVNDGAAALAQVRRSSPNLIISDVMMPNVDGFGLVKALRAQPRFASIPVILLSARAGEEATVEGLNAGADDYLVKPFSARELLARVGAALSLDRARRETERQKDDFLAMLAHELRNPLAPIRTAGELLARLTADTDAGPVVDIVRRQSAHLARLVDDLLDVSRITRRRVALQKETAEVAELIRRAAETVEPLVRERNHRLQVQSSYPPLHVHGDMARLVQSIVNLLINAAKYTEPGGEIHLASRREGDFVEISVRDNGMGIPAALLPNVFELFVQSERTLERAQGGLGIGLSVVRQLVEMHDGQVMAASDGEGQGSTFTIRLPAAEPPRAAAPAAGPVRTRAHRILVIADNADAADTLAMLLQLEGHAVQTLYDGRRVVEHIGEFGPELVLLDIGLPGMDGYEVARAVRQCAAGQQVRLVALTGYGQADDRARALQNGFDGHLLKPVDMEAITALLAAR
jgi:signal transduction histidine kinase